MKTVTKAFLALFLASGTCFGVPLKGKLEKPSDDEFRELGNVSPEERQAFRETGLLCRLGDIAVLVRDTGSGMYVFEMRIMLRRENSWRQRKCSTYSTGNPEKRPASVTVESNAVSIFAADGTVLDSFDLSH